ncbi:permease [Labrenzia sp. 011]|uniref:permease n=1 Tax=Labrenzia sp. 011 TaxID=2171494 RepID=UPI000D50C134|nr:permease [Labrenzia sp. 011]PVB62323.1 hypothetical protein DCO57_08490 [Labrenzia sp. 011]
MQDNPWTVALYEFLHVGGALVAIIAVISVLTGIVREYIPQDKLQKKLEKHERRGPLLGALLGTLTPFCSASMVPVAMGMVEMGASVGTIFGFLISAPLCNFVVVGLILVTFGLKVTLIYLAVTLGGAILAGYLVGFTSLNHAVRRDISPATGSCGGAQAASCSPSAAALAVGCGDATVVDCDAPAVPTCGGPAPSTAHDRLPHGERLRASLPFAWALFRKIIPYVLVGAVISALSAAFLPAEVVEKYVGGDSWYAVPVAAVIGVPLYLRIEMALPLLQVLIAKGMSMGAAMSLLIGGTGASLPEIAIISSILKPKAVIAFVVTVVAMAMVGGGIFLVVS